MTHDPHAGHNTDPYPTAEQPQADRPPADRPPADRPPADRQVRGRRLLWVLAGAGLAVVLLLAGGGLVGGWTGWLPSISNPFAQRTTDRTGPVLLKSIQDLSRFTAASGNFEVIVDVETSRRFIPDIIVGERTLFVAAGSVDAYVEFGGLTDGALEVDEANDTVEITLPQPELAPPRVDLDRSYVFAEQRGAANRIRDLFSQDSERLQQIIQLGERRIEEAAAISGLAERAEENTRAMLEGMLRGLGFEVVTVRFAQS